MLTGLVLRPLVLRGLSCDTRNILSSVRAALRFLLAAAALCLVCVRPALANPTVMQGNSATFPATGTDTPQSQWDIVRAGSAVATSSATNGWSVAFNTGTNSFTVGAPASAMIATNYEVRAYSSAGPKSAFFDVVASAPPQLSTLTLAPTSVVSGNTSTGTVTLTGNAPANGILVMLGSNDPSATVPGSVSVPSGQSSATFAVTTQGVTATKTVGISANYNSVSKSAPLTITPGPGVTALSLAPAGVTGGSSSNGRVTLSATASADVVVSLSSANTAEQRQHSGKRSRKRDRTSGTDAGQLHRHDNGCCHANDGEHLGQFQRHEPIRRSERVPAATAG